MSNLAKTPFYIEVMPSDVTVERRERINKNTGEVTPYFLQRVLAYFSDRSRSEIEITLSSPEALPAGKYIFSGSSLYVGKPFGDNPPRLEFNQWNVSYVPIELLKPLFEKGTK